MYGIRVPLAVDDYVWVIDTSSKDLVFDPKPLLFKTKDEASARAKIFGTLAYVKKYEADVV